MRIARYLGAGVPRKMPHGRHRRSAFRRGLAPARSPRLASTRAALSLPHLRSADRKSLLLGTALASTPLFGCVLAPTPAHAVDCFAAATPPPGASGPIIVFPPVNDFITCTNTARPVQQSGFTAAGRRDSSVHIGDQHYIDLNNSGERRYRRIRHLCAYPGQGEPSQRSQ